MHLVVIGNDVGRVDVDELRILLQVSLGEHGGAQEVEVVALNRPHFGLVEMQFLGDLEHADLELTACFREAFAAVRPLRLVDLAFLLVDVVVHA